MLRLYLIAASLLAIMLSGFFLAPPSAPPGPTDCEIACNELGMTAILLAEELHEWKLKHLKLLLLLDQSPNYYWGSPPQDLHKCTVSPSVRP